MNLSLPACTVCGYTLIEDARFCPGCGRRVGAATQAHSHYMTVLICDLAGSTAMTHSMGDEAMFRLITRFQRICTDAVADQGGLVAKFMGDGMLAYFGHPEPLKNSAEAAVQAASHILGSVSALADGLTANAGVATGWMVIGDMYDMGPASETLAVGGTVNLASRLQSEAGPSEIAVSEETRRKLDTARFTMAPRGRRVLRGLQEPVELWTAKPDAYRATPTIFIDRAAAQDHLRQAWERARAGRSHLCEIVAPGGFGKSALARRFVEDTVTEAATVELRAERHLRMQSYSCFRSLVRSVIGITPGSSPDNQRARLIEVLPEDYRPGLLDLMGLNQTPVSPVLRLSRMSRAVLAFLSHRLPRSASILMLEDAHWLDPDSLALLPQIVEVLTDRGILILAARRPDSPALLPDSDRLVLEPFDQGESERLIDALDPGGRIPATDRKALSARAAGVPLYLEHMTRAVLERSVRGQRNGLPNTIVEALMERVGTVGQSRDLIEGVAVLGTDVRTDILARMLDRPADDVRDRITDLIARGLLSLSGDGRIEFDHALVRDALLTTILSDRRRKLHRKAIDAYESEAPGTLGTDRRLAAVHYYGAGLPTQALPAMLDAAKAEIGEGELRQAAEILQRAVKSLNQIEDRDLREQLDLALSYLTGATLVQIRGFSDPAVGKAYDRALELCLKLGGAGETEFQIAWGIWAHSTVVGRLEEAEASCRRMDEIARSMPRLEVLARSARSVQAGVINDSDAREAALADVRALYDHSTDRLLAVTYTMDPFALALLFSIHGRWIAGDAPGWEAAIDELSRHGDRLGLGFLGPYIAVYGAAPQTYAPGDPSEVARIEHGIETAAELGQPFWISAGNMWLAEDSAWHVSAEVSSEALLLAVENQRAIGQTLGQGYHLSRLAHMMAEAGRQREAETWIARAEDELRHGRSQPYRAEILRNGAAVLMHGGDPDAALALLDEADRVAARDGTHAWRWLIAVTRAEIEARSDPAAAARGLRDAMASLTVAGQERHTAWRYAATRLDAIGAPNREASRA